MDFSGTTGLEMSQYGSISGTPKLQVRQDSQTASTVLMAEDDSDDQLIVQEAWQEIETIHRLRMVDNGVELIDYLLQQGSFSDPQTCPKPDLILLDLNMPKKDGYETLRELKSHPHLQIIPITIFSTSKQVQQVIRAYKLGANSYVPKPSTFEGYCSILKTLNHYWLNVVALPSI